MTAPPSPVRDRLILAATILGSSMTFIDGTAVNVALPALQADLEATVPEVQWVVEAYALFLSALLLVGGSLGDRFGRRRVFNLGVTVFALASAWCGLAPGTGQLIAARAVQGVGAALLVPGSLAILSAAFPGERRGRAVGTWSGFSAITAAVGPLLGGWLIDTASWRWIFFLNLPLAVAVLVLSFRFVPESRDDEAPPRLDWAGALLATVGLGGVTFGLIESPQRGWGDPLVAGALIVGVASLVGFFVVEGRSQAPMMPLSLFRSRTFSGANLLTLWLYAALGGALFFLPFNLIQVQGYSATAAGAALLPFILAMFLFSRGAGALAARYGPRKPLIAGPAVAAVGFALFAVPGLGGSYWTTFFPAVVVLGLGMALSVAPLTTTVLSAIEVRHSGLASGINTTVSRVAGLLAIAVLGLVILGLFNRDLDRRLAGIELPPEVRRTIDAERIKLAAIEVPPSVQETVDEAFLFGFRRVMLTTAGLALLASLSAWWLIGKDLKDSKDLKDNKDANVPEVL